MRLLPGTLTEAPRHDGRESSVDVASVRHRMRALREQLGLSQEEVADRANLSKNFVSAMERGAKGFGIESFLRYVDALGLSPAQALQTETEAAVGTLVSEEERQFIQQWRQLSDPDRRRVRQCVTYLGDAHEPIRNLARQQLDVIERAVYAERLKSGDGLASGAEDPPAG
jgi:transcriptional regulator with XRE-family HTH domain